MKTSDKNTLKVILAHKDYFDQKLLHIASSSEDTIHELKKDLTLVQQENHQLHKNIVHTQYKLDHQIKETQRLKLYCSDKDTEIDELKKIIEQLKEEVKEKSKQVDEIIKKNDELYDKLNKKIKKLSSSNSTNSNMASSFDILSHTVSKANSNTRKHTDKKRGGQIGHRLHKSQLISNPD